MQKYSVDFITHKEGHSNKVKALNLYSSIVLFRGTNEFPTRQFIEYLNKYAKVKKKLINTSNVTNFINGRMDNQNWLYCMEGYYSYIKQHGTYPKIEGND